MHTAKAFLTQLVDILLWNGTMCLLAQQRENVLIQQDVLPCKTKIRHAGLLNRKTPVFPFLHASMTVGAEKHQTAPICARRSSYRCEFHWQPRLPCYVHMYIYIYMYIRTYAHTYLRHLLYRRYCLHVQVHIHLHVACEAMIPGSQHVLRKDNQEAINSYDG